MKFLAVSFWLVSALQIQAEYFPNMWSDHMMPGSEAYEFGMHPFDQIGKRAFGPNTMGGGGLGSFKSKRLDLLNQPPQSKTAPAFQTGSNQPPAGRAADPPLFPNPLPRLDVQPESTKDDTEPFGEDASDNPAFWYYPHASGSAKSVTQPSMNVAVPHTTAPLPTVEVASTEPSVPAQVNPGTQPATERPSSIDPSSDEEDHAQDYSDLQASLTARRDAPSLETPRSVSDSPTIITLSNPHEDSAPAQHTSHAPEIATPISTYEDFLAEDESAGRAESRSTDSDRDVSGVTISDNSGDAINKPLTDLEDTDDALLERTPKRKTRARGIPVIIATDDGSFTADEDTEELPAEHVAPETPEPSEDDSQQEVTESPRNSPLTDDGNENSVSNHVALFTLEQHQRRTARAESGKLLPLALESRFDLPADSSSLVPLSKTPNGMNRERYSSRAVEPLKRDLRSLRSFLLDLHILYFHSAFLPSNPISRLTLYKPDIVPMSVYIVQGSTVKPSSTSTVLEVGTASELPTLIISHGSAISDNPAPRIVSAAALRSPSYYVAEQTREAIEECDPCNRPPAEPEYPQHSCSEYEASPYSDVSSSGSESDYESSSSLIGSLLTLLSPFTSDYS